MKIIATEDLLPFDIDETLIMNSKIRKGQKCISFTCPYTKELCIVRVNEPMLAVLRQRLARGTSILVWSKSGYRRAVVILRALQLDHKNLYVTSKFKDYADDKPIETWAGERIWLDPDCGYGK